MSPGQSRSARQQERFDRAVNLLIRFHLGEYHKWGNDFANDVDEFLEDIGVLEDGELT